MPLHFTLKNMARFDFTPYPHVEAWSQRISQRPSYQSAIVDWYPKNIPQPTETAA
jgi:glutathione S-transferase